MPRGAATRLICPICVEELRRCSAEELAGALATPAVVPFGLEATHEVCQACLAIRRRGDTHQRGCALAREDLALVALGWTSGRMVALRSDLRRARPNYWEITLPLACALVRQAQNQPTVERAAAEWVIVPVPTSAPSSGMPDPMLRLARSVGEEIDVPVIAALSRQKRRSTRTSVSEARGRIVEEEYGITPEAAAVTNRHVILFDDMATTGQTLAGAARLLADAGAGLIRPVVLDRTVSERVLQRVPGRAPDRCSHAE